MSFQFDRIFVDILNWVNQIVWWREGKVKQKPFVAIGKPLVGLYGSLQLAERPTPKAVRSHIFMPKRSTSREDRTLLDTYVLCDHLRVTAKTHRAPAAVKVREAKTTGKRAPAVVQSKKATRQPGDFTHRILILQVSHWVQPEPDANGELTGNVLFHRADDLQGTNRFEDAFAIQITDLIAQALLKRDVAAIDWEFEYAKSVSSTMKSQCPESVSALLKQKLQEREDRPKNETYNLPQKRSLKPGEKWKS